VKLGVTGPSVDVDIERFQAPVEVELHLFLSRRFRNDSLPDLAEELASNAAFIT
jgi:hypothetical protein